MQSGNDSSSYNRLFDLYNNNLHKGVRQVFKSTSTNKKELEYLYKFEANTTKFSAYKAKRVNDALISLHKESPEGFNAKAKGVLKTFNRFQAVECNTVVARSRTARQFMRFNETKELYQHLEWVRTRSANPRELHLSFVGLIKSIDDPFFKTNSPGELYGCKCSLRATDKPVTEREVKNVTPSKGLEGNPYFTREIFSEEHPYFKGGKDPETEAFITEQIFKQFNEMKTAGGSYFIHPLQDVNASDLKDLELIAKAFVEKEKIDVYVMPKMTASKGDLYNYLFKNRGAFENKCPDLLIGDFFYEYESSKIWGEHVLRNMISNGAKQADRIIIDVRKSDDALWYIKKRIINRVENTGLKEVWMFTETGLEQVVI